MSTRSIGGSAATSTAFSAAFFTALLTALSTALCTSGCEREPGAPAAPHAVAPAGMVAIAGGTLRMTPERRDAIDVRVEPFAMDVREVSNEDFAAFVDATGFVTDAERLGDSIVFRYGVPRADGSRSGAWELVDGATWRHPEGAESDLVGREDHPVVHVTVRDAAVYASWVNKRLPTEVEWEWAARGGLVGKPFVWGDQHSAAATHANLWQGEFPVADRGADSHFGTAPGGVFAPNGFGLCDVAGNVWEWVATPRGTGPAAAQHAALHQGDDPALVEQIRGGSYLCAEGWCEGYRPSARQFKRGDEGASNVGFRCVR